MNEQETKLPNMSKDDQNDAQKTPLSLCKPTENPPGNAAPFSSRRRFLHGVTAAGTLAATACSSLEKTETINQTAPPECPTAHPHSPKGKKQFQWKMALSWQKSLPGMGKGSIRLAQRINDMTNGELTVSVYEPGELCSAFEVFSSVSKGAAQMGHSAAYYWQSIHPATVFFGSIPGGMTADQFNAWIFFGGGLELWHELYAPYNLISFPAGNTGTQPGGWFKQKIRSIEDFKGIRMRIPGLAVHVVARLGVAVIQLPQPQLSDALRSNRLDAVEWNGPWNDYEMGFHKVAKYLYGPGFHEAGTCLECMIHRPSYEALPLHLQEAVKSACTTENFLTYAEYKAHNGRYFQKLIREHGVKAMHFPPAVMRTLLKLSREVTNDLAHNGDRLTAKISHSYQYFQHNFLEYAPYSDFGYLKALMEQR